MVVAVLRYGRVWWALPSAVRFRGRGVTPKRTCQRTEREHIFGSAGTNNRRRQCEPRFLRTFHFGLCSVTLGCATFPMEISSDAQAQAPSRLKYFTKAFHHFCQQPGTLCTVALVVFIAFQVLVVVCERSEGLLRLLRRSHKFSKAGVTAQGRLL